MRRINRQHEASPFEPALGPLTAVESALEVTSRKLSPAALATSSIDSSAASKSAVVGVGAGSAGVAVAEAGEAAGADSEPDIAVAPRGLGLDGLEGIAG